MSLDWRSVLEEYRHISDRLPEVNDLVYVSHIGVFTVDAVYSNVDIHVQSGRFPTSHYSLLERRTLR